MKLGIDLHGVIDSNPRLFKTVLSELFLTGKVEIYIVSGPPKADIIVELAKLGFKKRVHYKDVHSVVDFLMESGIKMWQDNKGRWWCNDKDWWDSKAKICNKLHLDAMVDDKKMYKAAFDDIEAKFVLYVHEE